MLSCEDRGTGDSFSIKIFGGRTRISSWLQYLLVVGGRVCVDSFSPLFPPCGSYKTKVGIITVEVIGLKMAYCWFLNSSSWTVAGPE